MIGHIDKTASRIKNQEGRWRHITIARWQSGTNQYRNGEGKSEPQQKLPGFGEDA
jgi:hypothetical protein